MSHDAMHGGNTGTHRGGCRRDGRGSEKEREKVERERGREREAGVGGPAAKGGGRGGKKKLGKGHRRVG